MEWQAAILAIQILLLAVSWVLFQKARADLSAQAAATPIMGEVKALQRNVKQLLTEIDQASEEASTRLEAQIRDARKALVQLEEHLERAHTASVQVENETSAAPAAVVSPVIPEILSADRPRARKSQRKSPVSASAPALPEIQQGIAVAMDNRGESAEITAQKSLREQRRDTVYRMADSGSTSAAIARATRLTEGEVETVLGLRRIS